MGLSDDCDREKISLKCEVLCLDLPKGGHYYNIFVMTKMDLKNPWDLGCIHIDRVHTRKGAFILKDSKDKLKRMNKQSCFK